MAMLYRMTDTTETPEAGTRRRWRTGKTDRRAVQTNLATDPNNPHAVQPETVRVPTPATPAVHRAPVRPVHAVPSPAADTGTAPVPRWMSYLGTWIDRTVGAVPLIAPLIVSGYMTYHVGTDAMHFEPWIAILLTSALEGGVWKLARLYEKTLVAGDSTISLRAGIVAYLGIISGLIYWHADQGSADWRPAAAVAAMSALGVYINGRSARWSRRVQLRLLDLVDRQAPKFSMLSWFVCPVETPRAFRHAIKYRISSPVAAVRDLRAYRAARPVRAHWYGGRTEFTWEYVPPVPVEDVPMLVADVPPVRPARTDRRTVEATPGVPPRTRTDVPPVRTATVEPVQRRTAPGTNGLRSICTDAVLDGVIAVQDHDPEWRTTYRDTGKLPAVRTCAAWAGKPDSVSLGQKIQTVLKQIAADDGLHAVLVSNGTTQATAEQEN